jgi:ribonuclease D
MMTIMDYKNIRPAIYIESFENLSIMVSELSQQKVIGVDTESNSLYEYEEKICLIQFSTIENDYLVDTIQVRDLSPLGKLFSDPRIQKVFHAAEYDLMCLKRDYSFEFKNIFDTMIASRILGLQSYGLSSLIKKYFNVSVDKKYQRANWGKRPLSKEMLLYAQLDTYFLIELRNILFEKLDTEQKLELANEDFNRITEVDAFVNNKNNDHYWKIIKGNTLSSAQESALIELYYLRENLAKELNRPPFKVFSNQNIIDIAKRMPRSLDELRNIDRFSPKMVGNFGEKIINAIVEGSVKKNKIRKQKPRPNASYITKYEALKEWRKQKSFEMSVDSDIILPKEHMELLAQLRICNMENIEIAMENIPYRFKKFGLEILSILEKKEG